MNTFNTLILKKLSENLQKCCSEVCNFDYDGLKTKSICLWKQN